MIFKRISLVVITIIIFCTSSCSQKRQDLWEKDINYLKTELAHRHKNLYFKTSQATFNRKLDSVYSLVDEKSDMNISIALQEVIALIGDDHTNTFSSKLKKEGLLPLYLYWFSDGIYVLGTFPEYNKLLGKKIVKINRHSIEQVTEKLSCLTSKTNDALIKKNIPSLIPVMSILKYYKITEGDNVIISYEDNAGNIKQMTIKAEKSIPDFKSKLVYNQFEKIPLCDKNTKLLFWYKYIDDSKILYVQYNKCFGKEAYKRLGYKKNTKNAPSFTKFSNEIISILESKEIDKFIFDMRYNPGGVSPQGTKLIRRIATIEEVNKEGKIFVIIGRRTYSSAILNSLDFQNLTKAIFVGEPTSGKPNHYGEVRKFITPNFGLKVNYSTKYFTHSKTDSDSFYPDYEIITSFEDLKNGNDPVMEWILNY